MQEGDERATEHLYKLVRQCSQYWIVRQMGPQDFEDVLHDTFVVVLEAVRAGTVKSKPAVLGYTRTIVRRKLATLVNTLVQQRAVETPADLFGEGSRHFTTYKTRENPHKAYELQQRQAIMGEELAKLKPKEREILRCYYLDGEAIPAIQAAMGLSDNKFRLDKSRAKQKLERAVWLRLQGSGLKHAMAQAA